ncbi:hypothetical protein CXF72_10460 [Psychromonas sp. MB-3u-54]|nr:hypothetical protein CXF72_10460 [Psychromonas sp. MB-3u-54]
MIKVLLKLHKEMTFNVDKVKTASISLKSVKILPLYYNERHVSTLNQQQSCLSALIYLPLFYSEELCP